MLGQRISEPAFVGADCLAEDTISDSRLGPKRLRNRRGAYKGLFWKLAGKSAAIHKDRRADRLISKLARSAMSGDAKYQRGDSPVGTLA